MSEYSKKDISSAFEKVGLKKGDVLFINPEIYKFGILKNANNNLQYFNEFYIAIKKIIGSTGTICINSFTFDTLRFNKKFVYENSKCTSGTLSEIILNEKKSVRSNHPVFSVAAIGKKAKLICKNNSFNNYGYNSPFYKFLKLNGKILNLGMSPWLNSFNHVAEFLIGVPHYYNKLTDVKYYKNGLRKKQLYSSFVRELDANLIDKYGKIKKELKKQTFVNSQKLGDGELFYFDANKYLNMTLEILSKDINSIHKKS